MKKALLISLLLPFFAHAQNYPDMNFQQMQKFYQQAQKAQECYAQIPEEKLKELEQKGLQLHNDTMKLCKAGKRDEAQKQALAFAKKLVKDETMLQIKKCGELFEGLQQGTLPLLDLDRDYSQYHICDAQQ